MYLRLELYESQGEKENTEKNGASRNAAKPSKMAG